MATCIQSITAALASGINLLPELLPSTITSFSISSSTNALLRFQIPTFQTIGFSVSLTPVGSVSSTSVSFTIFRIVGTTASDLGGVTLTNANTFFTKDLASGSYVICIRTNNFSAFTGTVTASFTGYSNVANLAVNFHDGAVYQQAFDDYHPPRPCDEAMFFEILDGLLPPGITMNPLGKLAGTLPNLDCVDSENSYSPSQNWYFEDGGQSFPWGRRWRFKVRVSLQDSPESFADDWFCIQVHNNWDFDRDNFLAQAPFTSIKSIEVIEPATTLPSTLCIEPCTNESAPFVAQPIQEICEPCTNPDITTEVSLIPIPLQLKEIPPSQFALWYHRNKDLSLECFELRKFIENLRKSSLFLKLLQQNGLIEDSKSPETLEKELLVASQYQNFLQITSSKLIEGRNESDLDYQMTEWKNRENQKLPLTALGRHGESVEVSLV